MQAKTFSYTLKIREGHLDTFGHVNNAVYLMLLEEARWDMLNTNGYGVKKMQDTGIGPTILEIKIVFLKELRLDDKITIETKVVSYDSKIGKIEQRIIRNDDVCSTAELTIGLFNLKERRLIVPTPEWLAAVGIL